MTSFYYIDVMPDSITDFGEQEPGEIPYTDLETSDRHLYGVEAYDLAVQRELDEADDALFDDLADVAMPELLRRQAGDSR